VKFKIVARILGLLLIFLAVAMLLPIPFSLYYGDSDYIALLISSGISLSVGIIPLLIRKNEKEKKELRAKEGFAVVTLAWIVFSAFGALPFVIDGAIPSYTDAFFETMSGFSATGATILTDVEAMPHGLMFWRSLTHWLGGMGIIVLSLAILPFLGVGGMQLFKAEVPGPVVDKLSPRITETAKILWSVYVLFTAGETILLMLGDMSFFDALCHSFGTMATGGFSTKNASIGSYGSAYIDYVIFIFMVIAGTNFSLHYRMLKGSFRAVWKSEEFRFYISIIIGATLLIGIDVYARNYTNIFETLQYTLFQVAAIITTTGYGTADYETWSSSSQAILFLLMFVGGCAGSTGGGMKVLRFYLLFKFVYSEIVKLIHPQAIVPVRIGGTVVDRKVMTNIAGFFVLFMIITGFGIIIMSYMGLDFPSAAGAVAATINNIGPGLGQVGPTDNYAFIPTGGKWLLSFFMLVGRLEVFTVIILLAPSFWRK
jgi:trk system potassium uptake protein TrkH